MPAVADFTGWSQAELKAFAKAYPLLVPTFPELQEALRPPPPPEPTHISERGRVDPFTERRLRTYTPEEQARFEEGLRRIQEENRRNRRPAPGARRRDERLRQLEREAWLESQEVARVVRRAVSPKYEDVGKLSAGWVYLGAAWVLIALVLIGMVV